MKVLARGSIREAPNPITWLNGLISLQASGGWDTSDVIRAWNDGAAARDRLTGQRFMTVRNILELEGEAVLLIDQSVSYSGSPYSEENLSSKKLLPGWQFKGAKVTKQSNWARYGLVTRESATYTLQYTNNVFGGMPKTLRQKPTKTTLEQRSEFCALAVALREDLVKEIPNIEDYINKRWLKRLAAGDVALEVELGAACASKDPGFGPRSCDSLRQLVDEFNGGRPGAQPKGAASVNLDKAQMELDATTFALLKQEIEFDLQSFQVFLANTASHDSTVAHQKNLWRRKLHDEAMGAAEAYLDRHATCYE
ncbi:unnamed protein product [Symbiodinium sp. CCMP2456]|nr:unnamed protein product [Symbiodinium sp. CCMP2456]